MSVARFAFGPRLKAHRERQGISLQDIAEATKIGASLLSSLERNDVSQWPKGIYRRAFLRSYARAIDIPFEPTWAEFIQLFPEDGTAPTTLRLSEEGQLRLTLAGRAHRLPKPSARNVVAAVADSSVVLLVGLSAAWATGMSAWATVASASLVYGAASTALVGGSLAQWSLRALRSRHPAGTLQRDASTVTTPAREPAIDTLAAVDDDDEFEPSAIAPEQRPRIFAIASTRAIGAPDARVRRVADR